VVNLYRCNSCGFRFYDPALAGTGRFYEELMTSKAYPLGGMDFDHVINFATRHGIRRVLDIGCGEGVFLDLARDAGITTTGVELNRNAAETAARKGHRMIHKSIKSIHPDELDGGAELLTLFQVLEHVPAPAEFVASAARLVKSGGHVAIAVPSDRRMLGLLENDPADWPPHHISRWRIEDLRKLGERAGLELVDIGSNPLFGTDIPWACKLHDRLEGALGRKMLRLPKPILECAALIYRSLRLKNISNFHGPSIRAIFRKSQKRPI
jgi:SAM-dependent methyltransferase